MAVPTPGETYNTTLGDLNAQIGNEEAALGEREGFEKTANTHAENLLTGQEPATYTAEENRANKGGLMTSGANSTFQGGRKQTIQLNFAEKRLANQTKLEQDKAENKRTREGYGIKKETGEHTAAQKKAAEETALHEKYPTVPPAAPVAPAAPPQPGAPANLGKWVEVPGGSVKVNNASGPRVISSKQQKTTKG